MSSAVGFFNDSRAGAALYLFSLFSSLMNEELVQRARKGETVTT